MYLRPLHTLRPRLAPLLHTAKLAQQNCIEVIDVLFRPLDARGHHDGRKTRLEDERRVFDDGEVDEGDLVDVDVEVAVEDALPRRELAYCEEEGRGKRRTLCAS